MTDRIAFEAWARENLPGVSVARLAYSDGYAELALEIRWQGYLLGRAASLEAIRVTVDRWDHACASELYDECRLEAFIEAGGMNDLRAVQTKALEG